MVVPVHPHGLKHRRLQDGASPLFIAAQNGHEDVCGALLGAGATVDCARGDGASPLWIAAQCGHDHVARTLLRRGAAVDHVRQDGATPLFKAAHKGHAAVVVELLKYKPELGLLPVRTLRSSVPFVNTE